MAGALAVIAGGSAFLLLTSPGCQGEDCPSLGALAQYRPPEPPRLHAADGTVFAQLPGPRRLVASLDDVPPVIREGFIAVEDHRFRDHHGVDVRAMLRATRRNFTAGSIREGASTITMQLARNVYGPSLRGYGPWRRKLAEVRVARAIEERLDKDRILELYLNQIYLGGGVYGVETAARHYFGKRVSEVTAAEAALLIGLAKNPEGYSPRNAPERALQRRNTVLVILARHGVVPADEAAEARNEPLELVEQPPLRGQAPYYSAAVLRELRRLFPDPKDREGLRVHTGLDLPLQAAAEEALSEQIRRIEGGAYGSFAHQRPDTQRLSRSEGAFSPYLQGMVVALDLHTGDVRTLVGGRDFRHSEFDRAFLSRRQPGSAFKPIVYSAAFAEGLRLTQRLSTDPVTVHQAGSEPWEPREFEGGGDAVTVREALFRSSNRAAVRVGTRVGARVVADHARTLGISTAVPPYPSIFLGTAEVVPADLVAAYGAIGNGGLRLTPRLITRIEDSSGQVVWQAPAGPPSRVLDRGAAFLTLSAMRDVVDRGTGWQVRQAGFHSPAAGKTGTTDDGRDVWFVGMTPELVAGVWLGFDRPGRILPNATGGTLAAPVWGRLMARAYGDRTGGDWDPPEEVVTLRVDASTGYLATDDCPEHQVREEYFLQGTELREYCPFHRPALFRRIFGGLRRIIGGEP